MAPSRHSRPFRPRPSPHFRLPPGYLSTQTHHCCPFCNRSFGSMFAIGGHLRHCKHQNMRTESLITPIAHVFEHSPPNFVPFGDYTLQNKYKELQNIFLNKNGVESRTGSCKMRTGLFAKGNWENYIAIASVFEDCSKLTSADADNILNLLSYLTNASGCEIALPTKYRTITDNLLHHNNFRRLLVIKEWIKPPSFLFGDTPGTVVRHPYSSVGHSIKVFLCCRRHTSFTY